MAKPPIDFTLTVYQQDEDGHYFITSSVPGLFLYGSSLTVLLNDVPFAVGKLREFNGDERAAPKPGDSQ